MTREEKLAEADRLEADARRLRDEVAAADQEAADDALAARLIYSATERCACGAGLAHDPEADDPVWDCSAVMLRHTLEPAARLDVETAYHPLAQLVDGSSIEPETEEASTRPVSAEA